MYTMGYPLPMPFLSDNEEPSKARPLHILTPLGKPQTFVKCPLQAHQAGPKELFALKGIQTLNLMKTPPRPKALPLEPTSLWKTS